MEKMTKSTKIYLIAKKVKVNKIYCVICGKYRKFEKLKYHTS